MAKEVDSVKSLKAMRKKLRKMAKLGKFPKFKYALEEAQEVKTRFTSTLSIFHSVICFDHKNSSEENVKKAKDNMDTINSALTQERQETDPETY